MKKLTRSATDRKLAGVCAGIAEYFDIDPTVVRIGWIVFSLMGGCGLLAYILCALLMPEV
jgi:phage shock protein C